MTELVKSASQSLNIFCVAPRSYVFNLLLFQLCFKFNSVQSADKAIEGNKQTEKAAWGWGRQTVSEQSYTRHMSHPWTGRASDTTFWLPLTGNTSTNKGYCLLSTNYVLETLPDAFISNPHNDSALFTLSL